MASVKKQAGTTPTDLRALDVKELNAKVAELKKTLVEQHRALAAQELPSSAVIRKTRKEIATTLTILGEKQRTAAEEKA